MIGRSELWALVEPVAHECDLSLFDIDMPKGQQGILRIYIAAAGTNGSSNQAVSLEDCEKLSRRLSAMPGFEDVLPERVTLEVSSPGVNRRLRLSEHFAGAIGEHVKVKARGPEGNMNIFGELLSFDGTVLLLKEDKTNTEHEIRFDDVREARVDFIFQ